MLNIEIPKVIEQILVQFYKFGVWSNEDDSALRRRGMKLIYVVTFILFNLFLISFALLSEDINETIYIVELEISIAVLTTKLIYILRHKEEIKSLLQDIAIHSIPENSEFRKINNKLKKFINFAYAQLILPLIGLIVLVISCLPIFSSEKRLPYFINFPFKWKYATLLYWLSYIFVTWAAICGGLSSLLNIIIWYLMLNCSVKYEILGNQFKKLGASIISGITSKEFRSEIEQQHIFLLDTIDLIKAHRDINEKVDRFTSCFYNLFFMQMATSGISICFLSYSLGLMPLTAENLSQLAVYLIILIYNFFDIFMVLYFGNEIKLSSERLSYCLFESNWIEQSKPCKKCIIIICEALKQHKELIILKLYPMNLKTFMSILYFAYSMFNILNSLN